jgi:hypothetical protein
MTGIDYGGVQITGLGFGVNVGWDALPWFTDAWDAVDPTFEDYIATVSTVTYAYRMPYVPAVGQEINIYVSKNVPTVTVDTSSEIETALESIDAGDFHNLSVKTNGTLWSWGRGQYGRLGLGNTTYYSSPKQIGALTTWVSISAGKDHSLARG